MGDDSPPPAATPPPAPMYAAPPSPSQQYTEVMDWNLANADKILANRQQYDPQFAKVQSDVQAQTAKANLQNFSDIFNQYGTGLAEANKKFALAADPLGNQRNDFILDQVSRPEDTEVTNGYRDLLSKPIQNSELMDALRKNSLDDLGRGGKLSDDMSQMIEEQSRGADSARGLAYSPASTFTELLNKDRYAEGRKQTAVQNAMNVEGLSQAFDKTNLEGSASLWRDLGTEKLQGVASKASLLGLSAPPRLGETTGAFSNGYQPTAFSTPFNNFADIGSTSKIYGDIANFNSNIFNTQSNTAASMYGTWSNNLSKNSTMGQVGQGMDMMGSMIGMVGGAMAM